MKEKNSILDTELSFIEWLSQLQSEIEDTRMLEAERHTETLYMDGFLQALEIVRIRYLKDQGVHTMPPKVYE